MSTVTARMTTRHPVDRNQKRPAAWVWAAVLVGLVLLALLGAWLAGWIRLTTDPRVTEIVALQEQARERFGQGSGPSNLADATAMATSMMEIRQKMEALPEHLRPQVERAGRSMFQSAFRARIDAYFALPPEQRQAEIDRQIDQEEMMRKAFEAGRTVADALGGRNAQAGASAPSSPPRPSGSRSEEERNRWRKSMIDRTTPQERARYTEWRRAIDARREQRGLPSGWSR
jgi:hypothetical protein